MQGGWVFIWYGERLVGEHVGLLGSANPKPLNLVILQG